MAFFKKTFYMLNVLLLFMSSLTIAVHAETENQLQVAFGVTIEKPDNQINGNVSYFDLNIEPGQKQDLAVHVTNSTEQVLNIEAMIIDAYTTINGTIDYNPHDATYDTAYPFKLNKMLSVDEKLFSLQPLETKRLLLTLNVPNDLPIGRVLGGIYFKPQDVHSDKGSENIQITNTYALVKGVQLTYGNTDDVPQKIDIKEAKLENVNQKQTLTLHIVNDAGILYKDEVSIQTSIKNKNTGEVYNFQNSQKYSIAPNSIFYFPLELVNKKIVAGTYEVDVSVQARNQLFEKKLEFVVNQDKLKETKTRAERVKETIPVWIGIVFLVLIIMLFGMFIYVLLLKRKQNNR